MKTGIAVILIFLLNAFSSFAQVTIPNADFEMIDESSGTKALNWAVEGELDHCGLDSKVVWKGKYSMHIFKNAPEKGYPWNNTGRFYQEIPFTSNGLKKYKVSAAIKTKDVNEMFAGLSVRVMDKEGNNICHQNMNMKNFKIKGTLDWKIYEAEFYVDESVDKLKIAGFLGGSGEAWFDDISIEKISISPEKPSENIIKYIEEYFALIRTHSIVKDSTHIDKLAERTMKLCAGNSDMEYCHFILKNITSNLNDGHSFFTTPQEWNDWQDGSKTVNDGWANFATGKMLEGNVAYINVPMFVSFDTIVQNSAVDTLQTLIKTFDQQNPKGWIIDISNNSGGNSFVMTCGLGPILGNGIFGYSISANGSKRTRIHNNGWTGWDSILMVNKPDPYWVKNPHLPIAVIYGNKTASSGEVVAIAFRGKENTKSFGQETQGASTRVDNLRLSDRAYLNLAAGYDVDRNGVVFGGKVTPDVLTEDFEAAMTEALKWILENQD
jgi:hypothetical protein